MNREELIEKIEHQRGFADVIDAYRVTDLFISLYGIEYHDIWDIEEELIYMYEKIKEYKIKKNENSKEYLLNNSKACSTCKEVKLFIEFGKNVNMIDGINKVCKVCSSIYQRAWIVNKLKEDPDYNKKTSKKWKDKQVTTKIVKLRKNKKQKK